MHFTTSVKMHIYQTVAETTLLPGVSEVAEAMERPTADVQEAFEALAEQRLLVLEPGDPSQIRMAPPFSGIETPLSVQVAGKSYYANCSWDALGIAAAFHQDADVIASCADSGQPLSIGVRQGQVEAMDCIAHFAVPAAQWWEDIVYT